MRIYIHVVEFIDGLEEILYSDIPEKFISDIEICQKECEYKIGSKSGEYKRQGKIFVKERGRIKGFVYACAPNHKISNKDFCFKLKEFADRFDSFKENYERLSKIAIINNSRFKHNITNLASHTLLCSSTLIDENTFKIRGYKNIVEKVKSVILDNPNKSAEIFLMILRYSKQIIAEIDTYELLANKYIKLEIEHPIHSVVLKTLFCYMQSLESNNVRIKVNESNMKIKFDYKSVTVVLHNIFHNILKYILPNSCLDISFIEVGKNISVIFEMISLKVESDELKKIFDSGFSGRWAKVIKENGTGLGLYICKRLLMLNNASIKFECVESNVAKLNDVPYSRNRIVLIFSNDK